MWKAPDAMKSMWSVRTGPCLVDTVEPSTIGSRSRCTPSRDTSGPCTPSRPAILSISSRKTMPDCSTRRIASRVAASWSIRRRRLLLRQDLERLGHAHLRLLGALRHEVLEHLAQVALDLLHALRASCTSIMGETDCVTSISTVRSSSLPSRSMRRSFSRVSPTSDCGGAMPIGAPGPPLRVSGGSRRSRSRSSASSRAFTRIFSFSSSRTMRDRQLGQVADDRLDVAADVADLGELRRLHLDERRLRQLGEAARDLGLPDAGRPDHDDVLGRDLVAQRRRAPACGASGCAARSRPRAWRRAVRRCSGRARRRSRAA